MTVSSALFHIFSAGPWVPWGQGAAGLRRGPGPAGPTDEMLEMRSWGLGPRTPWACLLSGHSKKDAENPQTEVG